MVKRIDWSLVAAVGLGLLALVLGAISAEWVWVPGKAPQRVESVMAEYDYRGHGM